MAHQADDPALRLSGLRKSFGSHVAVSGLDLDVLRGETLALLGPNGAGKSTTIRMICGLLPPTAGTVEIDGVPLKPRQRRAVGYCPQENLFYEDLTVLENLRFAGAMWRVPGGIRRPRAKRLAYELGLGDHMRKRAGALSGGMQRRLTIGLALMHDPDILVIEEPEAGLDPHNRIRIRALLADLAKEKTILFSSHNMAEVERLADRVAIIDNGILMAVGTPRALADKIGPGKWVDPESGPERLARRPTATLEDVFLALTGGAHA